MRPVLAGGCLLMLALSARSGWAQDSRPASAPRPDAKSLSSTPGIQPAVRRDVPSAATPSKVKQARATPVAGKAPRVTLAQAQHDRPAPPAATVNPPASTTEPIVFGNAVATRFTIQRSVATRYEGPVRSSDGIGADQLYQERAAEQMRLRRARIEARNAQGLAAARPTLGVKARAR
jgi:hypothetical protein